MTTVLETAEDIQWAYSTHVYKALGLATTEDYRECMTDSRFGLLIGNEDCPERLEFWRDADPLASQKPHYVWTPEHGLTWLDKL